MPFESRSSDDVGCGAHRGGSDDAAGRPAAPVRDRLRWGRRGATIDGTDVQEITVDGDVVFSAFQTPAIIDDFNAQNLSPYTDTSGFTFESSTAFEGSHNIRTPGNQGLLAGGAGGGHMASAQGDGLPNYIQRGDTWEIRMRFIDDDNGEISFGGDGLISSNAYVDTYVISVAGANRGGMQIRRVDNGSANVLAATTTSLGVPLGVWNHLIVEWNSNNTITATLNDDTGSQIAQISATDSTYANQTGVGLGDGGARSDGVRFDQWEITARNP